MQRTRPNRFDLLLIISMALAAWLAPTPSWSQTLPRLQSAGRINIGFIPDQAPFSSLSTSGDPMGYAVDLCRGVAEALKARTGLANIAASFTPTSLSEGMTMVEQGKIDLLCGPLTETLQTRERVSFSVPIYFTGIGAVVRKDAPPALVRVLNGETAHTGPKWRSTVNAGLANHTYAVHLGTVSEAWVRERVLQLGVIAKVVIVDSYEDGIDRVLKRQADAFFADRTALTTSLASGPSGAELTVLDRRFTIEPVALAMQRGDEDFRLAVDTALSKLYRSDDYRRAYVPYFGEPTENAKMLFQAFALP